MSVCMYVMKSARCAVAAPLFIQLSFLARLKWQFHKFDEVLSVVVLRDYYLFI